MLGGSHDYLISQPKTYQIKQDDKFFSKLLSKENLNSKVEASFRALYYGKNSSAIPFLWESQPGTPKHPNSQSSLPPLTPPPSYRLSPRAKSTYKTPKHKFPFNILKREFSSKKNYVTPANISSSSTSSSSSDDRELFVCHQRSSILCFGVFGFCKEDRAAIQN